MLLRSPLCRDGVVLPGSPKPAAQTQPAPKGQSVYVTRTGEKYHRDGGRYLAASKSPMSLKDAKAKGYTACEVCRPPEQCFPQHGAEALPRLQSLPALALVAVFKGRQTCFPPQ